MEISDPTDALAGLEAGHFVAHFCDHGCWYTADDSRVTRVLPEGTMATAFPYICFFERVDAVAPAWEPWEPNQTTAAAHEDAEGACSDEASQSIDASSEDDGSAKPLSKRQRIASSASAMNKPSGAAQGRFTQQHMRPARKQDRKNRKQVRPKQVRADRNQEQDRTDRKQKQDRTCRKQDREGRTFADNTDGSRRDAQANQCNPVERERVMLEKLHAAKRDRRTYGNIFLLLQLLDAYVDIRSIITELPAFFDYVGDDCSCRWSTYLRDADRPSCMFDRLSEALGIAEAEVDQGRRYLESGHWTLAQVAHELEGLLLGENDDAPASLGCLFKRLAPASAASATTELGASSPVGDFLKAAAVDQRRPCNDQGMPQQSAMPPRLRDRTAWFSGAMPTLQFPCQMCEAEFPNRRSFENHVSDRL